MRLSIRILCIITGLLLCLINLLSAHPSIAGWIFGCTFILYAWRFKHLNTSRKNTTSEKDNSFAELLNIRGQSNVRALVVYLVALAAAWYLTDFVWNTTGGLAIALSRARNPEYMEKIQEIQKDMRPDTPQAEIQKAYEKLSSEDKQELKKMSKKAQDETNWFAVTFIVSAFVFGLVGFIGGFISRSWILAGVVPALSFFTNNPVIGIKMAKNLPEMQKLIVVIVAQFSICYLLAYCGAWLGLKRKQKKVCRVDACPPNLI
jgi:hypothetical protein